MFTVTFVIFGKRRLFAGPFLKHLYIIVVLRTLSSRGLSLYLIELPITSLVVVVRLHSVESSYVHTVSELGNSQ